jgi:hypothetical protein
MAPDHRELGIVQRPRLLQNRGRHGKLADVVQQTTDRKAPKPPARKAKRLADLNRPQRDAARVPFRAGVLLRQPDHQRPYTRTEEGFLGRHQLCGTEVAHERARLRSAMQVERHGRSHERDPDELEHMARSAPSRSDLTDVQYWGASRPATKTSAIPIPINTLDPARCPKIPIPNPTSMSVTMGCGELFSEPIVSRKATCP